MRLAVVALVACSAPGLNGPVPPPAVHVLDRLAGHPERTIAALRPSYAHLGPAQLVELARAEQAAGHADRAKTAFVDAARFGGRGHWHWFSPHQGVQSATIADDGSRIVTTDPVGWIRAYDPSTGDLAWAVQRPFARLVAADGRWVIASSDRTSLYDLATGKPGPTLADNVSTTTVAADGHVFVARADHGIDEFEIPSGKRLRSIPTDSTAYTFAVGGTIVATSQRQRDGRATVSVYARAGNKTASFDVGAPVDDVRAIAVAPDDTIVVEGENGVASYSPRGRKLHAFPGRDFALARGGDRVATFVEHSVHVYDLASGDLVRAIDADWGQLALDPHGTVVTIAGGYGVDVFSVDTGAHTASFGRSPYVTALAFDRTGTHLAVGSGVTDVWDLASGQVRSIDAATGGTQVLALAYAPDDALAIATRDVPAKTGGLALWTDAGKSWSMQTDEITGLAYQGSELVEIGPYRTRAWSAAGVQRELAADASTFAVTADRAVRRDESRQQTSIAGGAKPLELFTAYGTDDMTVAAAFAPGGGEVALADSGGRISIWNAATGELVTAFVDDHVAMQLAWSGDVIVTTVDHAVHVWDRTGARRATMKLEDDVSAFAVRPDGRVIAIARTDGAVELWAMATATRIATLVVPSPGRGLVLAPDGRASGDLSDDDPLAWRSLGFTAPARAGWATAQTPKLLASLLAAVPADSSPRRDATGARAAATAPTCYPAYPGHRDLTESRVDGNRATVCVRTRTPDASTRPVCFDVDLAAGTYAPREPDPWQVLERSPPTAATPPRPKIDGKGVTVCHGACRTIAVPELATMDSPDAFTADDNTLVVADLSDRDPVAIAIYDVATGKRRAVASVSGGGMHGVDLAGRSLAVLSTPCAGPCTTGTLVDLATGRLLGSLGGDTFNASMASLAQVGGDVWAMNDFDGNQLVFQDTHTGRVLRTVKLPAPGSSSDSGVNLHLHHVARGVLVAFAGDQAGDLAIVDIDGKVVQTYAMPVCAP